MFNKEKFSKKVIRLRVITRLSLRDMAHYVGVSAATLSRIEQGKSPDVESFVRICAWAKWDNISMFSISESKK